MGRPRDLARRSSPCRCRACTSTSRKRIPKIADPALLRTRDFFGPSAQTGAELIRPLIRRLENHAPAFPAHQDLPLRRKAAGFRKPDGLTSTVLEQLRTNVFHRISIDASIYTTSSFIPLTARLSCPPKHLALRRKPAWRVRPSLGGRSGYPRLLDSRVQRWLRRRQLPGISVLGGDRSGANDSSDSCSWRPPAAPC